LASVAGGERLRRKAAQQTGRITSIGLFKDAVTIFDEAVKKIDIVGSVPIVNQ